jgi:dTDP-4-dehydrorhamnose reductase
MGLLGWFLAQQGPVKGFTNAIYTGLVASELVKIVERILLEHPKAFGLYQISADRINKYDLLMLFRKKLGHNIEIVPDETFHCDRSLDSSRFRREFGYTPPTWDAMVETLRVQLQEGKPLCH